MTEKPAPEQIEKAYVIGAGFSKAFNLPLVQDLLDEVTTFCHEKGPGTRDRDLPDELEDFKRRFFPFFPRVQGYQPSAVDVFVALEAAKDLKKAKVKLPSIEGIDPDGMLEKLRITLCQVFHHKLAETASTEDIKGRFFREIDRGRPPVFVSLNWDNFLERGLWNAEHRICFFDKGQGRHPIFVFKPHGSIDWLPRQPRERRHPDMYYPLSFPLDRNAPAPDPERSMKHRITLSRLRSVEWPDSAWEALKDDPRKPMILTIGQGKAKLFQEFDSRIGQAWQQAGEYLERADEIVIIGYSMPEDDVEVKLLIRGAIWRHQQLYGSPPSVKLVNPDKTAWERFREAVSLDCQLDMRLFHPDMVFE